MTHGPALADAPLARAVLARRSWRPAGTRAALHTLDAPAARRAPMLARARGLQAWHDGLARRWRPWPGWRPLDMAQPARPVGATGAAPTLAEPARRSPDPAATPGDTGADARPGAPAALPGPDGRRSGPDGRLPPRTAGQSAAAPPRVTPIAGAAPRVQRKPAAAPTRPALAVTALAAPADPAPAAPPLPSRPAASAAAPDGADARMPAPAIGRQFARREVAGGFPATTSAGSGARAAVPAPPVRWRIVETRLGGAPRTADGPSPAGGDGGHVAPESAFPPTRGVPASTTGRPFPARAGDAAPAEPPATAGLADLLGASAPIPLPGLSLRVVPPEEAARRLAAPDGPGGRHGDAPGARSEAGARRDAPPAPPPPPIDIDALVDRVQRELQRRERFERERKGLY